MITTSAPRPEVRLRTSLERSPAAGSIEIVAPNSLLFARRSGIGSLVISDRAFLARQQHQQQADGALSDHEHIFPGLDARLAHRFQAGVDRLDERGLFKSNIGRQREHSALDDPRHGAHILREAAAAGLEARGESDFLIFRALRKQVFARSKNTRRRECDEN